MSKNTSLILAVGFLIVLFVFIQIILPLFIVKKSDVDDITIGNTNLRVIIADEHDEQINGLSNIMPNELSSDGMLFIFDDSQERVFWMKDMNFALDIAWISQGEIVKIEENIDILDEFGDVRRMHSEPFEVDTVLELPSGSIEKYSINVGDSLNR
jgi:uncharacterized membrane protein (UPF0127 family)